MSNAKPLAENAQFIQHHLPGLEMGEYALRVHHEFASDDAPGQVPGGIDRTTPLQYKIAVKGPRFRMDPTTVHAVFPPDQSLGEFSAALPHVVLTNETLPWLAQPVPLDGPAQIDRKPFGSVKHDRDVPTWLAVLILTDADFAPYAIKLNIESLATAAFFGNDKHEFISPASNEKLNNQPPWIKATDMCQAVRLPIKLFNDLAPSLADLFVMANVRKVAMGSKAIQAGNDSDEIGGYSVVMGNRLPVAGQRHTAVLVSLENMDAYLPDHDGNPSKAIPASVTEALLPVLAHWTFISDGDSYRFDHLLQSLNGRAPDGRSGAQGPLPQPRLKVYPPGVQEGGSAPAAGAAVDAIELGFVPMQHVVRSGVSTASWYRGPLLPHRPSDEANQALQFFRPAPGGPVPAVFDADALARFDPSTGLFDVAYAAAWQLGRLLALQDKSFSIALYQWKRANASASANALEQQVIEETFGELLQQIPGGDDATAGQGAKSLVQGALRALVARAGPKRRTANDAPRAADPT